MADDLQGAFDNAFGGGPQKNPIADSFDSAFGPTDPQWTGNPLEPKQPGPLEGAIEGKSPAETAAETAREQALRSAATAHPRELSDFEKRRNMKLTAEEQEAESKRAADAKAADEAGMEAIPSFIRPFTRLGLGLEHGWQGALAAMRGNRADYALGTGLGGSAAVEESEAGRRESEFQSASAPDGPMGWFGNAVGTIAGSLWSSGKQAVKAGAAGAVIGGAAGAPEGGIGAVPGAVAGATTGFTVGFLADSYRTNAGAIYGDLSQIHDPGTGAPMDHQTAFTAAVVGGSIMATLDTFSFGVISAPLTRPLRKKLTGEIAQEIVEQTRKDALKAGGIEYLKSVGTETVTETVQQVVQDVSEDLAKSVTSENYETIFNDDKRRKEVVHNAVQTALVTAAGMSVVGAPGAVQHARSTAKNDLLGRAEVAKPPEQGKSYNVADAIAELGMTPDEASAFVSTGKDPRPAAAALEEHGFTSEITPEDTASPVPTDTIAEGKGLLGHALETFNAPAPIAKPSLPADIVQGLIARGIPAHVAQGAAAGVVAESGNDHNIINPDSGAAFLGQWLGSRKDAIIARYGPHPTREQQIDFLAYELKGGDQGGASVLAATTPEEALNRYITDFMRPAKGAETDNDIKRGLAALGGTGTVAGIDPEAAAEGTVATERRRIDTVEDKIKQTLGEDIFEFKSGQRLDVTQNGATVPGTVQEVYGEGDNQGVRVARDDGTTFDENVKQARSYGARLTHPVAAPIEQPGGTQVAVPEVAQPKSYAGEKIDNEYTAFHPSTETLGIPRAEMPQIKQEDRGAAVNFFDARGISVEHDTVPASSLKPSQAEFAPAKVQKFIDMDAGDRAVLVSNDGYVLDGHHQWVAALDQGGDVRVIRLGAPIRDLIKAAHEFPSSRRSDGTTPEDKTEFEHMDTLAVLDARAKANRSYTRDEATAFTRGVWEETGRRSSWAKSLEGVDLTDAKQKVAYNKGRAAAVKELRSRGVEPGAKGGDADSETRARELAMKVIREGHTTSGFEKNGDTWAVGANLQYGDVPGQTGNGKVHSAPGKVTVVLNHTFHQHTFSQDELRKAVAAEKPEEAPRGPRVIVNHVGRDGKTDAERGHKLEPRTEITDARFKATWTSKSFKPLKEDVHRESEVAHKLVEGYLDGQAGNIARLREEVAAAVASQPSILGDGSNVFNPIRPYLQAYLYGATGELAEVRTKGGFRDVLSPQQVLAKIEGKAEPTGDQPSEAPIADAAAVALVKKAQPLQADLMRWGNEAFGHDFKENGSKSYARILEKTRLENYASVYDLKDVVRGAILVDTPDAMSNAAAEVAKRFNVIEDKGPRIVRTGYRDHKLIIDFGDRVKGEIQIVAKPVWEAKYSRIDSAEPLSAVYNRWRVMDKESPEAINLEKQMEDGYAKAVAGTAFENAFSDSRSASGNALANASSSSTEPSQPINPGAERQEPSRQTAAHGLPSEEPSATGRPSNSSNVTTTDVGTAGEAGNIPAYGSTNRVFTKERADAARALVRDKLKSQVSSGFDPEFAMAGMQIAGFHIEAGARKFAALSKALADDLGVELARLKPYIAAWYNGARDLLEGQGEDIADMDGAGAVRAAVAMIPEPSLPTGVDGIGDNGGTSGGTSTEQGVEEPDRAGDAREGTRDAPGIGRGGDAREGAVGEGEPGRGQLRTGEEPGGQRSAEGEPEADGRRGDQRDHAGDERGRPRSAQSSRRVRDPARGTDHRAAAGSLKRTGSWRDAANRNLDVIELVNKIEGETARRRRTSRRSSPSGSDGARRNPQQAVRPASTAAP
jgi:hypothetical protein